MSTRLILSIALLKFGLLSANYLEAESNYMKPKLERNNVLNKKVWIKNKSNENLSAKSNGGQYMFRSSNSIAADDVLQNNFDAFSDNFMQDVPFVSSYIQRSKRTANDIRKVRHKKSLKNCVNKIDCQKTTTINKGEKSNPIGSKLIPDLKPASVFNDYPYEVAILLSNNNTNHKSTNNITTHRSNSSEPSALKIDVINLMSIEADNLKINSNKSKSNTILPKRSNQYAYKTEPSDRIEFITVIDGANGITGGNKTDRNIFNKDDRAWHQNAPLSDVNFYKVIPKEPAKIKSVNERALVKVISTLTKTFKKIMKQHNDIKTINHKLQGLSDDLLKNIADITKKFHDFDIKYSNLIKLNDKIKRFESDLEKKEQSYKNKQKEMTKNLIEFENQQKKFLAQQKQFYAVQQLILAQNEKINIKQNLIAKTQSEISYRQNNFARILKKAKQIYTESKNSVNSKGDSSFVKLKNNTTDFNIKQVTRSSTFTPPSSESIKINLFSIPIANRIENQDEILIKEKDQQPIDELVYKFYFNNTFIDNIMRSKVLNSIATIAENREVRGNVKNKRNELTTILLPVNRTYVDFRSKIVQRNKRWINHYSRKHYKRRNHGKEEAHNINTKANSTNNTQATNLNRTDPFLAMATSFCNEIRRNANSQVLGWCIEKTLRRLQYMDAKLFPTFSNKSLKNKTKKPSEKKGITTISTSFTNVKQSTPPAGLVTYIKEMSAPLSTSSSTVKAITNVAMYAAELGQNTIFFPDNDELESNLKEYELKPDTEGNVYYEGSLHASEIVGTDSEGYSDLLPDPHSDSKMDMSPLAYNYQARRYRYMM